MLLLWPLILLAGLDGNFEDGFIGPASSRDELNAALQFEPERTDLTVRRGEVKTIPARTYMVANLVIEEGGILRVLSNQTQWVIFDVSGDAKIDGRIEFENMRVMPGPITATAPDGTLLSFEYPANANGGYGGDGGQCGGWGGQGAPGTAQFGGGGGGGGFNGSTPDPHLHNGDPATDWRGAARYGRGGDGGQRNVAGNGGVIYIAVKGSLSGAGWISVTGKAGSDGKAGDVGGYTSGAGGGGGGAPGGHGGYLKIKAGRILSRPNVAVDSGKGGKGGPSPGRDCLGRPGRDGDDGGAGYDDITDH